MFGAPEEEDLGVELLTDIKRIFRESGAVDVPTGELLKALIGMDSRPWADLQHGRAIGSNGLSRLLRPFGIQPRAMRVRDHVLRGYSIADFSDAFTRYLPEEVQQAQQSPGESHAFETGLCAVGSMDDADGASSEG
jgi:hypothetical protein